MIAETFGFSLASKGSEDFDSKPMRPAGVIVRNLRVVLFSQQSGLQIAALSVLA